MRNGYSIRSSSRQSRACGGVVWGVVRGRATGVKEACDRRDLYGEPQSARALQIINPLPPDIFSPFLFVRLKMLLLAKPAKSWPKRLPRTGRVLKCRTLSYEIARSSNLPRSHSDVA